MSRRTFSAVGVRFSPPTIRSMALAAARWWLTVGCDRRTGASRWQTHASPLGCAARNRRSLSRDGSATARSRAASRRASAGVSGDAIRVGPHGGRRAVRRPELVREASRAFGASTIVVSIEAIRRAHGGWEAYTDNGRESTGVDAAEWAQRATELGAGELMVTSIDQEGTGKGFDLELTRVIAGAVSIPVIAGGGAGSIEHVVEVVKRGKADAVSLASILHYRAIRGFAVEHDFADQGNTEYLRSGRGFSKVADVSLGELKAELRRRGVPCRAPSAEALHV